MENSVALVLDFRFFFVLITMVVCCSIAGKSFYRLYHLATMGKKESVFDRIPERLWLVLRNIFLHGKLLKDFWPGFFHACIFFGFVAVTLGTGEHVIEGLFHGFNFSFLGPLYGPLVFIQDILQWAVVAGVLYFFYRRLILKPKRASKEWRHQKDGLIVLSLTGGHMFADIMAFAFFTMAGDPHAHSAFRPMSTLLAQSLGFLNLDVATATQVAWIFWGLHIATVFGFLMYIPHSKHLHIITAGLNIYFARLRHRGTFSQINFADETQTNFGVGKFADFSWKDVLDTYSCTACGRCNEYCPTATTGKPLQPMKLIEDIKLYGLKHYEALKAGGEVPALVSEESGISFDTIWACTSCKACVEACPVMIEHVDKIVDIRRNMVLMEGKMPEELQNTMKNWENTSNPWGMAPDARDAWCKELNIARAADKPNAEYLFYVGCAGSFNDRNKKISTAFVKILQKANIDFAILGKEELCNGETARRAGNEYLAKSMIDANIAVLQRYNVKKILATCPHCFNTLKNEYPDFGFKAEEVIHHTEFIDRLLREGKITPEMGITVDSGDGKSALKIAFHDSCYLGRYNEVYEAPRNALRSLPGVELVEMPRNKSKGLCCGAGGARMWMEETIGKRINVERVEEALAENPQVIAAGCPFCQVMVSDGVTEKGQAEKVQVKDIAEIVADTLK